MWLTKLLATAATIAGIGLGLLYWFQERLIYIPRIPGVPDDVPFYPDRFGLDYEDVWLTASDGTKLHAWLVRPPGARPPRGPLLIFFQENAGTMAMRLPFLRLLVRHLGCAVLAPSYRGYGLSQGSPTERGLRLDAAAALSHALGRADVDPARVGVFGRSLGGAVALALAASRPEAVAAVVVENTFLSIEALAPKVMPFLAPIVGPGKLGNFLIRNKWRNQDAAAALVAARKRAGGAGGGAGGAGAAAATAAATRSPRVLLISSLDDEMLPPEHMALLHALLLGDGSENNTNSNGGTCPANDSDTNNDNDNNASRPNHRASSPQPNFPPPVAWLPLPGARHMDAYETHAADYWPPLVAFAADVGVAATGTTPAGSAVSG